MNSLRAKYLYQQLNHKQDFDTMSCHYKAIVADDDNQEGNTCVMNKYNNVEYMSHAIELYEDDIGIDVYIDRPGVTDTCHLSLPGVTLEVALSVAQASVTALINAGQQDKVAAG